MTKSSPIGLVDLVGVGLNATDTLIPLASYPERGSKMEYRSETILRAARSPRLLSRASTGACVPGMLANSAMTLLRRCIARLLTARELRRGLSPCPEA